MSFESLLNKRCTIVKKSFGPLKNAHGQPQVISTSVTNVACGLQERAVKEGRKGDQSAVSLFKLFLAYRDDLTERDQVIVDGKTFDVLEVRSPGGRNHHISALVELVK